MLKSFPNITSCRINFKRHWKAEKHDFPHTGNSESIISTLSPHCMCRYARCLAPLSLILYSRHPSENPTDSSKPYLDCFGSGESPLQTWFAGAWMLTDTRDNLYSFDCSCGQSEATMDRGIDWGTTKHLEYSKLLYTEVTCRVAHMLARHRTSHLKRRACCINLQTQTRWVWQKKCIIICTGNVSCATAYSDVYRHILLIRWYFAPLRIYNCSTDL